MSTIKVDGIKSNGDTSSNNAITLADNTTCTANITNNLSNRNLIINGAMQVAQRATTNNTAGASSTYKTLDRWMVQVQAGTITESQQDLTTSDTPYSSGFRKYMRLLNQSGVGAGASQYVQIDQRIEAQDVAQSGWNYTSSSSFITVSFWVRASQTQSYIAALYSHDGTQRHYPFEISLTGDQWTKITKTIPGESGITVNNDNGIGLILSFIPYYGTNYTSSSGSLNAWNTTGGGNDRWPDMTTTWATTTNATFDVTGVQLEVSDYATDFEHRSYGVEKKLCMRYYQEYKNIQMAGYVPDNNSRAYGLGFIFPVEFRSAPTLTISNTGSSSGHQVTDGEVGGNITALVSTGMTSYNAEINVDLHTDMTNYRPAVAASAGWGVRETKYMFNGEL